MHFAIVVDINTLSPSRAMNLCKARISNNLRCKAIQGRKRNDKESLESRTKTQSFYNLDHD